MSRESRSKRPPLGAWLMSSAPSTAEALGHAGFDVLVLDIEHVPIDLGQVIPIMRGDSSPCRAFDLRTVACRFQILPSSFRTKLTCHGDA